MILDDQTSNKEINLLIIPNNNPDTLATLKQKIKPERSPNRQDSASSDGTANNMASDYEWSLADQKSQVCGDMSTHKDGAESGSTRKSSNKSMTEKEESERESSLNLIGGEELMLVEESTAEFIWLDKRTKTWHFSNTFLSEMSDQESEITDRESYRWLDFDGHNIESSIDEKEEVDVDIEEEIKSRMAVLNKTLLGDRDKVIRSPYKRKPVKEKSKLDSFLKELESGLNSLL